MMALILAACGNVSEVILDSFNSYHLFTDRLAKVQKMRTEFITGRVFL
jgi:hypothetical protein